MTFTTGDNPHVRRSPRVVPRRFQDGYGAWYESTGEVRHAEPGEYVLATLGVAQAARRTTEPWLILRKVNGGGC